MPRVKRGTMHVKRRKNILKDAKGFMWGRKNLLKLAKVAITKAGVHAYFDRKKKKSAFRGLWNIRLNAFLRENHGISYSKFIPMLTKNNVELNRKVLSEIAAEKPAVMNKIIEEVK